jgi:hypothetical protein
MRTFLSLFAAGLLVLLHLCSCALVGSDHDVECAGMIETHGGFTIAGPHIRDGYYSRPECVEICEGMHAECAPVIEQHTHHHGVFRCGPSGGDHCGPRHTGRPNLRGACDSEGFDRIIDRLADVIPVDDDGDAGPQGRMSCKLACGRRWSDDDDCRVVMTLDDGRTLVRCGEDVPEGCPRPQPKGP